MTWPSAGQAPNHNVVGLDPQLRDPEHGDFRPAPGSPALGYGCQTFPSPPRVAPRESGAEASLPFPVRSGSRRLEVSGLIATDTLWDADTVHVVGEVTIGGGATLGIAPGVRVVFDGYYALTVGGRLLAAGTPEEPIRFDSADPQSWAPDSSTVGSWGGIRFDGTPAALGPSRLEWCELTHAKGVGARKKGGALSMINCSVLRVRNCVFHENAAEYGAVLFCEHMANPVVAGSLLHHNTALTAGSAVYCIDSYPRLFENTIAQNACLNPEYMYDTGVIHNHLSKTWVAGNIVYGNTSSYFLPLQIREAKPFCVRYSDVQYGIGGEGDFDADPRFAGSGAHPYRLAADSPCRNAGPIDTTGFGLLALDLAAVPRNMEGRIDVGAYESGDPAGVDEEPDGGTGDSGEGADRWGAESDGGGGPIASGAESGAILRLTASPNPFSASAAILVRMSRPAHVRLTVHDAGGRRVGSLFDGDLPAGERVVLWDGRNAAGRGLPPGIYLVRAEADGRQSAGLRLVLGS